MQHQLPSGHERARVMPACQACEIPPRVCVQHVVRFVNHGWRGRGRDNKLQKYQDRCRSRFITIQRNNMIKPTLGVFVLHTWKGKPRNKHSDSSRYLVATRLRVCLTQYANAFHRILRPGVGRGPTPPRPRAEAAPRPRSRRTELMFCL